MFSMCPALNFRWFFVLCIGIAPWLTEVARAQEAQEPGAVLTGAIYDSTTARVLQGARVALWGTSMTAFTDSAGRFQIDHIPPGEYSVVFFHPRLAFLGVSGPGRSVRLQAGERTDVRLATPSVLTIAKGHCALESGASGAGTAVGFVGDVETGVPFPEAEVRLSWVDEETGVVEERNAFADGEGWYRFCGVPWGVRAALQARFLSRVSARKEFIVPEAGGVRVDFKLGEVQPATLTGVLLDKERREPIADVALELRGTGRQTLSDAHGRFRFEDVPPGDYSLRASHVAYGTQGRPLSLGSGQRMDVEIQLAMQPIELDAMTITIRGEIRDGIVASGGRVITRQEIERHRQRARDVGDLLRAQNVSGLIVRRQGQDLCIGFLPAQARISARGPCVPMVVFIDGVRATDPYLAFTLPAESVERMVLYRPIEAGTLFGLGSGNGILMIFTRSYNRR